MASEVRRIELSLGQVPRIFSGWQGTEVSALDIIAHVRGEQVQDPWVPVVLVSKDTPVAVSELEEFGIFWEGHNDTKAAGLRGISSTAYCVVNVQQLDCEQPDCGLEAVLTEFGTKYSIHSFEVLVCGQDDSDGAGEQVKTLTKLKQFIVATDRDGIHLPYFLVKQNKLREDGLDISEYIRGLVRQRSRNSLDASYLDELLEELEGKISPGNTVIQDLNELRTTDVKLLSTYLMLSYALPPIYVASFIAEYIKFEFFYPRTKLSLYERIMFLKKLPPVVGYLGNNHSFNCYAQVLEKIYPVPHYVFNITDKELLSDEDVESGNWNFNYPDIKLADFRSMFQGSSVPINYSTGIAPVGSSDAATDKKLVDLFAELSKLVKDEPVYLSVKNSVLVNRYGKVYLMYCPEELGVRAGFVSEYFGLHETLIREKDFNRLIDAQYERAILKRDRASTMERGNKELAVTWKSFQTDIAMQPAIPFETSLYMNLLPLHQNGLSYYDRCLRCHANILPIVTSIDSEIYDVSPLFKEIPLSILREDPVSRYAINCFGTITDYREHNVVLPVTYKSFKQRGLL